MKRHIYKSVIPASFAYSAPRTFVQSNLSVTPSEMLQLTNQGVSISSGCDPSKFYDGDSTSDMSLPLEYSRGVDINDAWNAQQSSRRKLIDAQINDINTYGK